MKMIKLDKKTLTLIGNLSAELDWEQLATGWNFHQELGQKLFEATYQKGLAEGLNKNEIVEKLIEAGCKMQKAYIYRSLDFYDFKEELRNFRHGENFLNESEEGASKPYNTDSNIPLSNGLVKDNLKVPENEGQYRYLGKAEVVTSSIEKVEEYTELYENKGEAPSSEEVREHHRKLKNIKYVVSEEPEEPLPTDMPKFFLPEQLMEFRAWIKKEHHIDAVNDKPKVDMLALSKERDEVINELLREVPNWKGARKEIVNKLHPDKGGSNLAFSFFKLFDELMKNISSAYEFVVFQDKILRYKKEWWELTQVKNIVNKNKKDK